jgi:hypothetical protein
MYVTTTSKCNVAHSTSFTEAFRSPRKQCIFKASLPTVSHRLQLPTLQEDTG